MHGKIIFIFFQLTVLAKTLFLAKIVNRSWNLFLVDDV